MFGAHAPSIVLSQPLHELIGHLSAVREGSEDAIHEARVTIRRAQEVIALAQPEYGQDELEVIEERLSRAARALSRARDADIAQQLVERLEARLPFAGRTLADLRAMLTDEQIRARQKAVKKLEALELETLAHEFAHTGRPAFSSWSTLRTALRRHIKVQAAAVRDAVEHAGGVYFPNRLHSARVATRRLRYTLELANQVGMWHAPRAVDLLRKVQTELGKAHDRHIMLARLDRLAESQERVDPDEVRAVKRFIRSEALARHARYLDSRADILAVCEACMSASAKDARRTAALVAAGLAVPSLLLLRRRSRALNAAEASGAGRGHAHTDGLSGAFKHFALSTCDRGVKDTP